MTELPNSLATMLWLVLAVWLLGALAYALDIPGNIVGAGLLLGTAAAIAEWRVRTMAMEEVPGRQRRRRRYD